MRQKHCIPLLLILLVACTARSEPFCREKPIAGASVTTKAGSSLPAVSGAPSPPPDARSLQVWREFVAEIHAGTWPDERFLPYPGMEGMVEQLRKFLRVFRGDEGMLRQFDVVPRVFRVPPHIHFIIPWVNQDGGRVEFLFTVIDEGDTWRFRLLENLQLPLYAVPALPSRSFPRLEKETLEYRRAEELTTKDVILWKKIKEDKGEDAAFQWFRDGVGYRLQVLSWLPYFPPHIGFVLYLCWKESDVWGNDVVLQELDDAHAVVRFEHSLYFQVYERSTNFQDMIGYDDYRKLFESIWNDRASKNGWSVAFSYGPAPEKVELRFTRQMGS